MISKKEEPNEEAQKISDVTNTPTIKSKGVGGWVGLLSASIATPIVVGSLSAFEPNLLSHVVIAGTALAAICVFEIKERFNTRGE
jgi:hypothetical protein